MHYFSPVHKMPLLEIITHPGTAEWVTATCVEVGRKQGKTVIVVNDGVGFYTSRILAPYMNEAAYLLAEGADIAELDKALVEFGFPVGPITLLDEVGIDVAHKVGPIMEAAFGKRLAAPKTLEKVIEDGRLGRKNQKGFYTYTGKKKEVDTTVYALLPSGQERKRFDRTEMAERCAPADGERGHPLPGRGHPAQPAGRGRGRHLRPGLPAVPGRAVPVRGQPDARGAAQAAGALPGQVRRALHAGAAPGGRGEGRQGVPLALT